MNNSTSLSIDLPADCYACLTIYSSLHCCASLKLEGLLQIVEEENLLDTEFDPVMHEE